MKKNGLHKSALKSFYGQTLDKLTTCRMPLSRTQNCREKCRPPPSTPVVEEEEAAEREVNRLWEQQVFDRLRQGDHLCIGGGGLGHRISSSGIDVDRIEAAGSPNQVAKLDGHIATTGTHVDAPPALADPEALERGLEGTPVDVIAQTTQSAVGVIGHSPTLPHGSGDVTAERAPCPRLGHLLGSCG